MGSQMEAPLQSLDQAFEELYTSLPDILGQAFVEEMRAKESFPLLQQGQQRLAHELSIEISSLRQRCRNGLRLILQELHTMNDTKISSAVPHLEHNLSSKFHTIISSKDFTQIVLRIVSGETWRESLRLPRDTIDLLYTGAKAIFEDGRFQEATDCFAFLSWFDARQYDFWMALGHSQFHCAHHEGAISSYGVASHCLPEESWPHIYSATCFEALGDFEQASQCMKEGIGLERKKPSSDRELILALERKIDQYRQGSVTPIS
jgi:tetratricopeptide (TPR) repeat protein